MAGKIYIKKKSGPGEITGITEIDLSTDNKYDIPGGLFKDIQFTDPGDYIVTIFSDINNTEFKDINIKVLEEDLIPQAEKKSTETKQSSGSRPIISQIDKPTIVLPPIKMDKDISNDQSPIVDGFGYTPVIWYKSYAIDQRYITNLNLYHDGIVPKIRFTFVNTTDIIKGPVTPTDNSTIELFLNSTSKNLKSIHIKFKIEEFVQSKSGQKYTISGTIDIPGLYVVNNKSYNETSFNTIRSICKEIGMGFNSNIDNTNDKMSWKNTNKKPHNFINDIVSRSYISDESFMIGYIDYYYCFNYVDVEKEMNRDISDDVGIDTSGISEQSISNEDDRIIKLILTNDKSQSSSSCFIESFTTTNEATKKSLSSGYSTVTKFYDRTKKRFLIFNVDSTTSDGVDSIILKGEEGDKYPEENINHSFIGKIDTDNAHDNYNYSYIQNSINLNVLSNVAINTKLPNPNWNLYKFQKIKVNLINDAPTFANPSIVNWRYSGDYIIADIEYVWSKGKAIQNVRLVRKELGKTPEEIKNTKPPTTNREEIKEVNTNPNIPGLTYSEIVPNSKYSVGQVYKVNDKEYKVYDITVIDVLNNGYDIVGDIVDVNDNKNAGVLLTVDLYDNIKYNNIEYTIISEDSTYSINSDESLSEEFIEGDFLGEEENQIIIESFIMSDDYISKDSKEKFNKIDKSKLDNDTRSMSIKNPSNNQDFWTLVAICSREDDDPQAWCDIAQSIYNRVGSKAYRGDSICKVITQKWAYEPTWRFPDGAKRGVSNPNKEWYSIENIKDASLASGRTEKYLQQVANALKNKVLQNNSSIFIQGRTDFLGTTQPAVAMTRNGSKRQRDSKSNNFGFSYNYPLNYKGGGYITYNVPLIVNESIA